jgi:hypothetical protein
MTTYIPFQPNNNSAPPFQTNITMDGNQYASLVTWNLSGQRWYMAINDQNGNNVWTGAMIGSPLTHNIYLAPGIFSTSTILYREDTGNIEVNP